MGGLNSMTDFTENEMKNKKGKHRGLWFSSFDSQPRLQSSTPIDVSTLPKAVDWRQKGVVTPVKSQGCGDCWAFASTETLESAVAIASGKKPPILSPQQLVACAPNRWP